MKTKPTTCTKEVQKRAWEYCYGGWMNEGHSFPSAVGLCIVLNVARSTLYDWAKREDNEISDTLAMINLFQQQVAWDKGLNGEYNSNLVKLLLGNHGFHDKLDSTHGNPDGSALTINVNR